MVKGTGPDGKSFTLCFDKQTGLPLKLSATVRGFQGEDFTQDTTYSDYKDFDGVKLPAKEIITINGKKLSEARFTSYKSLSRIEDGTFDRP